MRLDKVLYLCTVILNILIMVQGKKQLSSKPKFAEVVIGDNEAKEMRESELINNKKRSHEATFKY